MNKDENERVFEFVSFLLTPTKLTLIQQEEELIFEVTKDFQQTNVGIEEFLAEQEVKNKIKELVSRCGWFHMEYMWEPKEVHYYENLIRKRLKEGLKESRIVLLKDGKINVYEGDEADNLAKELLGDSKEDFSQISEVNGVIGYPGKVKGKVALINSINDKHKFQKGDILVAHDGTAELTYFLTNASAIVTDQGGMICHAAIVSREMKIPSVLGTTISTKVFKDGDLVEVDAEKGIVRKV